MSNSAPKKGRPTGSKTADRVIVKQLVSREACPHCDSKLPPRNKRLRNEGKASGELFGQPYGYYRHYAANCSSCAAAFNFTVYEPSPEE